MDELRLTGNCLRGSRPLLSFDANFEDEARPHLQVVKESLIQVFGTPRGHPKSKPFFDHVMGFYVVDGKIWFRHYQINDLAKDAKAVKRMEAAQEQPTTLVEIGPRFAMEVVKIFDQSFGGRTLYSNPDYISPNRLRHELMLAHGKSYEARKASETGRSLRAIELVPPADPLADVFAAPPRHQDGDDDDDDDEAEEEEEGEEGEEDDDEEEEEDDDDEDDE
jgi:ribosome biogenesis protein BRX1